MITEIEKFVYGFFGLFFIAVLSTYLGILAQWTFDLQDVTMIIIAVTLAVEFFILLIDYLET